MASPSRDPHGRLIGTTISQDLFMWVLLGLLVPVILVSLLLWPPARRVGSPSSWT